MNDKAKATLIVLPLIIGLALSARPICVWVMQAYMRGEQQRMAVDMQRMNDQMRQFSQQKPR